MATQSTTTTAATTEQTQKQQINKPKPKVEVLNLSDSKKAGRTLFESFGPEDSVARYVNRHLEDSDLELKQRCDLLMYEAYTYSHMLHGLVVGVKGEDTDSDSFETVAVWLHPESTDFDNYITLVRSGFARLAWMTGAEGRKRIFNDLFKVLHDQAEQILSNDKEHKDNVWTLVYLGSTPAARGKGNVRAIFEYMIKNHVDPDNALLYLESSAFANIPIYEKFGLRCVGDIWVGDKDAPDGDCARMDVMIRGPQGQEWKYLKQVREQRGYVIPDVSKAL
ncbi:unnamed protein product [Ambrosiozyma monospora]|uniref:Unnamed protein product n=1 Tax=Ambrosiozyma monospora TaxID=43982 RepID=A0A9W7DG80_AMBMO|nr:unnamed protein product [Ambrosiozyma monospora]